MELSRVWYHYQVGRLHSAVRFVSCLGQELDELKRNCQKTSHGCDLDTTVRDPHTIPDLTI
jgi:hypothetical protein